MHRLFKLLSQVFKGRFLASALLMPLFVLLAVPSAAAKSDLDQQADKVIEAMEKSGALDRAVSRAIDRYASKKQEEQRKMQEEMEKKTREMAKNVKKVDPKKDHIRGDVNAPISLIVFSDFECPFCQRFHLTPNETLKKYGKKVNWVYRHFPLDFHNPMATDEAIASECIAKLAGNEAFWTFADAVYEYTQANAQGLPENKSMAILAKEAGVNADKFSACLKDPQMRKIVEAHTEDGKNSGVTGTPGTVVRNNKTGATELVVGALPVEALNAAVEKVMGK